MEIIEQIKCVQPNIALFSVKPFINSSSAIHPPIYGWLLFNRLVRLPSVPGGYNPREYNNA